VLQHSGGDPTASAQSARVILADPNTEVFQHLVKVYQGVPDKYIESYLWVKKCVEKGSVVYTPLVYKNPGGRRPGEEYDAFIFQKVDDLADRLWYLIGEPSSARRTNSVFVIGSPQKSRTKKLAAEPEIGFISNYVT
jgi:hypothetical protein